MRTRLSASLLILVLAPAIAGAQGMQARVSGDTSTWAGLSGQWRLRGENWNGYGAGAPGNPAMDDAFGLSRFLLRGEGHLRGRLGLVAELKSSLVTNRTLPGGRRLMDEDVFDVQQLYAEAATGRAATRATLRVGRFDMALGRERLVSPLDWTNSRRGFQGTQATLVRGAGELRVFWVQPIQIRHRQPNLPDTTRQLYGAQASRRVGPGRLELYWLRTTTGLVTFNGTTGYERRHTLGGRWARAAAPRHADADVELALQRGSVGASPVRAWMAAAQFGWTFSGAAATRVYLGLDAASGDHAAGGSVETFNQLYPLSHAYLGYIDMHGRENVVDLSAGASLRPTRALQLMLDVHDFRRASSSDAMYGAEGLVNRAAGTGLPNHEGTEVDLTLKHNWQAGRLLLQGGASRYFPGAFITASAPASNATWFYLQLTAAF